MNKSDLYPTNKEFNAVRQWIEYAFGSELLTADDLDRALVGVVEVKGSFPVVVYDKNRVIELLLEDGCTLEEALEHFDFNIADAYVGHYTPGYVTLWRDVRAEAEPPRPGPRDSLADTLRRIAGELDKAGGKDLVLSFQPTDANVLRIAANMLTGNTP
jgi:hypothetical protein